LTLKNILITGMKLTGQVLDRSNYLIGNSDFYSNIVDGAN
jgi:hypothetical protein